MNSIKILKKSITFSANGQDCKLQDTNITQGEFSEDFNFGMYFSTSSGLCIVNLNTQEVRKIDMSVGVCFYTFQKYPSFKFGIGIVLAHDNSPEGERFWVHELSLEKPRLSDRKKSWR
ncbi:hypothetical protein [Shewanella woodyi]|uniref:hypothetical protein n=1 Tax=Shewanella woodyi TaxID=60961 RepID=UPI00374933F5